MQAGVSHEILAHGGGDGADVAHMLHHGCQRDGHDGDNRRHQQATVEILAEDGEHGLVPGDGQAHPVGLPHQLNKLGPGVGIHNHGEDIGGHHAQEDGDDFNHALAEDVGHNHNHNGHQCNPPVIGAVIYSGVCQSQADADDDGAGDDGREIAHDLLCAEGLEQGCQHQVDKTGTGHAEACIGQGVEPVLAGQAANGRIAADKGEGGAQEGGHLPAGNQMEQQCAQAGKQQGIGHVQAGQRRNQHRCAEHGEQMLHAQNQLLGGTQGAGIIDGIGILLDFCHK